MYCFTYQPQQRGEKLESRVTMSEAKNVETVASPVVAEKRKNVQVATTIPAEFFDGLEDRKWTSRVEVKDQVLEALQDYAVKHAIKIDGSAPHAKR